VAWTEISARTISDRKRDIDLNSVSNCQSAAGASLFLIMDVIQVVSLESCESATRQVGGKVLI
jgi:hypothetical protein